MNKSFQLKWRCRRGMKELEILLIHYLEHDYEHASKMEQHTFCALLELPDLTLHAYLIGQQNPSEENMCALVQNMKQLALT